MAAPTVDGHFSDRSEKVRALYDRLVAMTQQFGPVEQDPKKTSIHLNRATAFAGIAVRKNGLVLTIKSDRPIKSARLHKSEQTSAKRFHHEVKITKLSDLDAEIREWLWAAYELSA